MKRMLNRKRRPSTQKKGLKSNRRYLRTIKNQKKDYTPPSAPYNTSQYLIENNSSPFFDESDDDIDADFVPSSLILIKESENLIDDTPLDLKKISSFSTQGESFPLEQQLEVEPPCYL